MHSREWWDRTISAAHLPSDQCRSLWSLHRNRRSVGARRRARRFLTQLQYASLAQVAGCCRPRLSVSGADAFRWGSSRSVQDTNRAQTRTDRSRTGRKDRRMRTYTGSHCCPARGNRLETRLQAGPYSAPPAASDSAAWSIPARPPRLRRRPPPQASRVTL
jgi:hypothetical protein